MKAINLINRIQFQIQNFGKRVGYLTPEGRALVYAWQDLDDLKETIKETIKETPTKPPQQEKRK